MAVILVIVVLLAVGLWYAQSEWNKSQAEAATRSNMTEEKAKQSGSMGCIAVVLFLLCLFIYPPLALLILVIMVLLALVKYLTK